MNRTCVPLWLICDVAQTVTDHGMGAHDILFGPMEGVHGDQLDSCYFDAVTASIRQHDPETNKLVRGRVFSATKYNGNADEVTAILSM